MALGELAEGLACLAIVQEYLAVGSDARKVVPTRRVPHVLDELGVCLDRLWPGEDCTRARALWSATDHSDENENAVAMMGCVPYRTYRERLGGGIELRRARRICGDSITLVEDD